MKAPEFQGPGLTEAQWEQVKALAKSLDAKQLIWVSGFLAGIEHRGGAQSLLADPLPAIELPASSRNVTILYGSETGNSAAVAASLCERAKSQGLPARLRDMAAYKTRELKDEQDLLIITSTHGEGDPPQPAAGFFEFVEGRKAPRLPDLRFAVLALGDSSYEHYCEAGKRLDRRLEELGATRLMSRVDCDVDYDEPAAAWIGGVLDRLAERRTPASASAVPGCEFPPRPVSVASFDKRNPLLARVIDNIVMTGRGSSKETRHIELSLEGSGLTFEPGDALGVVPANDPSLVEAILDKLGLDPSTPLTVKGKTGTLADALTTNFEITTLTPRFLEQWARLSEADELQQLTRPDRVDERTSFLRGNQIIDVIRRFPVNAIDAESFVAGLRPLQPRLYSIASSLAAVPDEAHLTVSTVRYNLNGERRAGVASSHLAERGAVDELLPVYVQQSPHFRLPADDVPIIMIGAGTGVAPYRAFMQEREIRGASGRSWLIFGERNFRTDFLYQTEWQALLEDGVLNRMDVAFSRDRRREESGKVYVQHRLKEHSKDVFAWLEEGAHLYVCGDASRLAPDVDETLRAIVQSEGGLGPAAIHDYLDRLKDEHRYQLDVY